VSLHLPQIQAVPHRDCSLILAITHRFSRRGKRKGQRSRATQADHWPHETQSAAHESAATLGQKQFKSATLISLSAFLGRVLAFPTRNAASLRRHEHPTEPVLNDPRRCLHVDTTPAVSPRCCVSSQLLGTNGRLLATFNHAFRLLRRQGRIGFRTVR
jgi:hypothetical protein